MQSPKNRRNISGERAFARSGKALAKERCRRRKTDVISAAKKRLREAVKRLQKSGAVAEKKRNGDVKRRKKSDRRRDYQG